MDFIHQMEPWIGEEEIEVHERTAISRAQWPFLGWETLETVTRREQQTRVGIRSEITGVDTVRNSIGDRIVDVSIVPFIRA